MKRYNNFFNELWDLDHRFKEIFNPRLHHADFQELVEDVDYDVFKKTHNFKHMKYIKFLHTLSEEY